MARTSRARQPKQAKKSTRKTNGAAKPPVKTNGAAQSAPEPEETSHEAEARRAEERAAKAARHIFETTAATSARILESEQDERRSLRQTGEAPYIGQDGSGDLNPKATLGDILPEVWGCADSPDNTVTEHALEDVYDSLQILAEAVRGNDDHMSTAHVQVARFLERVAKRSNLTKHLARRIAEANEESSES